jgi:hypothetical protein
VTYSELKCIDNGLSHRGRVWEGDGFGRGTGLALSTLSEES